MERERRALLVHAASRGELGRVNNSDIHSGKARDRALASLRRAEELDSRIHAFTQLFSEKAIARAEEIDRQRDALLRGPAGESRS